MDKWYSLADVKPPEKKPIIGMDAGGSERPLVFYRNMFWLRDMSMYVYYTPRLWKYDDSVKTKEECHGVSKKVSRCYDW